MPKVKDILAFIDTLAPFDTQCDWDNSGLAVGDGECEVGKVVMCLDITRSVVEFAAEKGAQLIVSHHPVIFHPRRQILSDDPVYLMVQSSIAAICCHTPLDKAPGGVNDVLAQKLGFVPCRPLADNGDAAMVRVYDLPEAARPADVAALVSEKLHAAVRFSDGGKPVKRIALCGGAGEDFIPDIAAAGCDMLVTGEGGHHDALDAAESGISFVSAGHFETENPVVAVLGEKIASRFGVEVLYAPSRAPYVTVINKD